MGTPRVVEIVNLRKDGRSLEEVMTGALPYLTFKFRDNRLLALIDTGAQLSVANKEMLERVDCRIPKPNRVIRVGKSSQRDRKWVVAVITVGRNIRMQVLLAVIEHLPCSLTLRSLELRLVLT